jgi:hypothetical protein
MLTFGYSAICVGSPAGRLASCTASMQGVFGLLRKHTYSINPIEIIDFSVICQAWRPFPWISAGRAAEF